MALSKNTQGIAGHFWVRLAGLTGALLLVVGLVVIASADGPAGLILAVLGGALAAVAVVVEVKAAADLFRSRRGAVGSNVLLQVLLAVVLLAGVNAFSFFHYARVDLTRDREFSIDPEWAAQLARLRDETRIVVYQRHTFFGQGGAKQ